MQRYSTISPRGASSEGVSNIFSFFSSSFFPWIQRGQGTPRRIKHTGLMHRYKYNAVASRGLREINYATYLRRCDAVRRDRGPRAAKMRRDRARSRIMNYRPPSRPTIPVDPFPRNNSIHFAPRAFPTLFQPWK